ncbi:MAG: hypothetical protein ABIR52_00815 [Casimicrobiaceae bacterium]
MATELTFSPGYVPGLRRSLRSPSRRFAPHAAAPVSPGWPERAPPLPRFALRATATVAPECDPPMTAAQRRALAALIHTPVIARDSRWSRDEGQGSFLWVLLTAGALAWTLAIAAALLPDVRLVRSIEVPRVAMPQVVESRDGVPA